MTYPEAIGLVIEQRREDLQMTHEQLSEVTGMSLRRLKRVEKGEVRMTIETLYALGKGLRMAPHG